MMLTSSMKIFCNNLDFCQRKLDMLTLHMILIPKKLLTYRVEILKASEVALSKKILKEIEALPENSKIVIVCEYTLLRALKSIIHNLIVYNNKVVDFSNITYI